MQICTPMCAWVCVFIPWILHVEPVDESHCCSSYEEPCQDTHYELCLVLWILLRAWKQTEILCFSCRTNTHTQTSHTVFQQSTLRNSLKDCLNITVMRTDTKYIACVLSRSFTVMIHANNLAWPTLQRAKGCPPQKICLCWTSLYSCNKVSTADNYVTLYWFVLRL